MHSMIDEYLEAMNSASQTHLGPEIRTPDGVVFRKFVGADELLGLVLYALPQTPGFYRPIKITQLEAIMGKDRVRSIFSENAE